MLGNHFFMLHRVVYSFYLSKSFFYQLKNPQHLKFQVFDLNMVQFSKSAKLKKTYMCSQAFIEILKQGKKTASTKLWVTSFIHVFKAV